jgi:single-strand DNA-binding protein
MGGVNKVILVGRLGRDAELKYTPSGAAVSNFSIATSESWKDKNSGERKEKTEWHRIVIWGKTAENLSQYLLKGKQIYLEGKLETREWEDKEGHKRSTTEVKVGPFDRLVLLSSRDDGGSRGSSARTESAPSNPSPNQGGPLTDDDIPF